MELEFFKAEIDRAFYTLGRALGKDQNLFDLSSWLEEGYIDLNQYDELKDYIDDTEDRYD